MTTWGELNEARDNAILITTWYSGTHQIWRDVYVGPDHALNPERYFIVAINQIGNGLSVAPHNADGPNAEHRHGALPQGAHRRRRGRAGTAAARALRHRAARNSSSADRWARSRPTNGRCGSRTRCAGPHRSPAPRRTRRTTSSSPRRCASSSGPTRAGTTATTSRTTDVVDGLKRHAHIWAVMGFSTEFWKQEVWRALEFTSKEQFIDRLPGALLHRDGPERPADDGVEVAARRRRRGTREATSPRRWAGSRRRPS